MTEHDSAPAPATQTPGRGERRRIATRARLLAAARVVFARQGLADTTVGQITQAADLGLGTFYLHFATKDDIFRAVLMEGFGELSQRLETTRRAANERNVPWWGVVRLLIAAYYAFAAEHRELFAVMCAGGGAGEGVSRELEEQFARDIAEQMLSIQQDRATGATMYPYPTQPVASALVSALNRAVLWWMGDDGATDDAEGDERQSLEALIDTMSRFITAALGGRLPSES